MRGMREKEVGLSVRFWGGGAEEGRDGSREGGREHCFDKIKN